MQQTVIAVQPVRLGRKEAAQYLGLSVRSLDYLIEAGRIKARRTGARVFIQVSELVKFATTDSVQPITSVKGGR